MDIKIGILRGENMSYYATLYTEGLNVAIREGLASAIRERNKIERERLEFDKEVFEFNKQINLDVAKANTDIANTIAAMADKLNDLSKHIEVLYKNDTWVKNQIDAIRMGL